MNSQKKRLFWKISSWMGRRIRDIDQFSTPILLRYKGDTEFKTEIGGFVSLSLLAFLIVYACLLLKQMINRENSVINSNELIENLMYNPTKYNLSDYNFAFGFKITPISQYFLLDPTYFTTTTKQVTTTK